MESAAQGEILSNDREVLVAKYHGPIEANDRNNFGVEDVMRSRGALKGRAGGCWDLLQRPDQPHLNQFNQVKSAADWALSRRSPAVSK